MPKKEESEFKIVLPKSGRGVKEIKTLLKRRKLQLLKAIQKLKKHPADLNKKGLEKLNNPELGQYTIRVSKGDRIFYDVDTKNKIVYILRAGKHDLYRLL